MQWNHFPHFWPYVRVTASDLVDYPKKEPVEQSFDVFFDVSLNELVIKQMK